MALDAGMVACLCHEFNEKIIGAKVDKIYQPSKDELLFSMRAGARAEKLLLSCASNSPMVCLTEEKFENPLTAPMLCMLLRKHLAGGRLLSVSQPEFERVIIFEFSCLDEMGDPCTKYMVAELLGKFSNIILLNSQKRILGAVKTVDFSASEKRQILPGFVYELPPKQDKFNPLIETKEGFIQKISSRDTRADQYILSTYAGLSPLMAREIVYKASKMTDAHLADCDIEKIWFYFKQVVGSIKEGVFQPVLLKDRNGKPIEYSFTLIQQYGAAAVCEPFESPSRLIETFFKTRSEADRVKQKAADILKLLSNAEARLNKKIALQTEELARCAKMEEYRQLADLIHAHMVVIKRGMKSVQVDNYFTDPVQRIEIPLDERLSASANAQRYYKKYNKAKAAKSALSAQIEIAKADLDYISSVFDALTRAKTTAELEEIRQELYETGFASRMKNYVKKKAASGKPLEYTSSDGFRILCGKNNTQNDLLTFKTADKNDYWFHVKNAPGSHVILCCRGQEPPERAFTEAACIAAAHSKLSEGENVPVDYTKVRNVKKPPGGKPGYVIYHTNWTAYVSPEKYKR